MQIKYLFSMLCGKYRMRIDFYESKTVKVLTFTFSSFLGDLPQYQRIGNDDYHERNPIDS